MAYQSVEASDELPILAALADPTRRAVLERLRGKLLSVGELASQLPVTRPAVSQHLKILKEAQLVCEHRQGVRHYFGLNPTGFAGLREYADSMWQEALDAFATYVAAQTRSTGTHRSRIRPPKKKKGR